MEGADPRGRLSRLGEGAIRSSNVFVPLLVLTFFPQELMAISRSKSEFLRELHHRQRLDAAQSARDAAAEDTAPWQRRVATTSDCVAELKE
ncbi:hypothetical protein GQ55_4G223100 [Panicum hallii var. hallii]|uniref:Uncharacterized protein n=1 Tax=Panicum hallii var. hallii TaxID=1504633 RepID=A0A2T7DZD3_9POAL|nr:hypothetical protein GQ55_4G222900 [Panicum hallii var. hallii]PUZ60943.1 hypothetical protein GQ55_4G223100 [Panicum hallii var. hallii]